MDLTKKLEALRSDLALAQKILAEGGFRNADGDWHPLGDEARARKSAQVADLKQRIAAAETKLAAK